MKISIDSDTCAGCRLCVKMCPSMFRMNEDRCAEVIDGNVPETLKEAIKKVANSCPVDAIILEE